MVVPVDRVVNQLVRLCLFGAAIDNLLIAQLLVNASPPSFVVHVSSGLLCALLLVLHPLPAVRRWRGAFYGALVVVFWSLVSHYAPLWDDPSGRIALLGLLTWLFPLLIGAGVLWRQSLLAAWTVACGTLIVLAWSVQAPSDITLQAGSSVPTAAMAALHWLTAAFSTVSLGRVAFHYQRAYQSMAIAVGRDYLTGLVNRGRLYELLRQEMARATRRRRPLSLFFYDIDNFGIINKEHGHPIGDRVLRTFSQCVQDQLRHEDHLGRWGGEEFMAIIPDTSLEDAYQLAERVRQELAATPIAPVGVITASFGVVTWHAEDNIESLLGRLDVAVREAKWHGKNRVVIMRAPNYADDDDATNA